jgi:hypothetical protein
MLYGGTNAAALRRPIVEIGPAKVGYRAEGPAARDAIAEIDAVMAPFACRAFRLNARTDDLPRHVTSLVCSADLRHAKTVYVSLREFKRSVEALPEGVRAEVIGGFRAGLEHATSFGIDALLKRIAGPAIDPEPMLRTKLKDRVFGKLASDIDTATGGLMPPMVREGIGRALAFHAAAIAARRGDAVAKLAVVTGIYKAGHLPVGLLKDGSFLVIVE